MLPVLIDDDAAGLKHGVDGPQSVASSKTLCQERFQRHSARGGGRVSHRTNSELPVSTMTFRVWFGVPSSRAMRKCRPSSERVNGIVTSAVDTACVNATQRTVPLQCMSEVYAAPAAIPDSWHADTCIVTGWQWHPTTYLQHRLCETTTLLLPHSAGSADCPVPSTINQVVSPRDARN